MNTMRYLCSLFGASTDDLVTAETPAGFFKLLPLPLQYLWSKPFSPIEKVKMITKTGIVFAKYSKSKLTLFGLERTFLFCKTM